MNNTILNPDEDGIGEIGVRSRNVFMGYHKDQAKTEESFQVNCKIFMYRVIHKDPIALF